MRECFCCRRGEREVCLCQGPTCRRCLRCEDAHCICLVKPLEPTCDVPVVVFEVTAHEKAGR